MSGFDDREKSYENKFAHDLELAFKAKVRRDKLFAQWVAPQLGLSATEAAAYANALSGTAHEKHHDDALIAKVLKDFAQKGVEMTEHRLRKHLNELHTVARAQVMSETKS
jgi:hypothetical protein